MRKIPPYEASLGAIYPEIALSWHPVKNGCLTPFDKFPFSDYKAWWLCLEGHSYDMPIKKRTCRGDGCPFCSGRRVDELNSLKSLNPSLAKEWHPVLNKSLLPEHVTVKSDKYVWWMCKINPEHEWKVQVKNRSNGSGCPICKNRIVHYTNSLDTLFRDVAKEWHPSKNGKLTPKGLVGGSNKKVWWQCRFGHEWEASVVARTARKTSCPKCFSQTSKIEVRIFCELKAVFDDVEWQFQLEGIECDVFIKKYNLAIEFDGWYWHKGKPQQDIVKNNELAKRGIILIRVRQGDLERLAVNDIFVNKSEADISILLKIMLAIDNLNIVDLFDRVQIKNYLENKCLVNIIEYKKILAILPCPPPGMSVANTHSHIDAMWDYEKNYPLTPELFTAGSEYKVWWLCPRSHNWITRISHISNGHGCPYCCGNKPTPETSIAGTHPDIAKWWHPVKNEKLTIYDVKKSTKKKVWWLCKEGHEYCRSVASSTKGAQCPTCKSLGYRFPDIAKEWHPTKNGKITPYDVAGRSGLDFWWQCSLGHDWQASVHNRTAIRGSNCPECKMEKEVDG